MRGILELGGEGCSVGARVIELRNLLVSEMTDADDQRPLLLHGAGLDWRSGGYRSCGALGLEAARGRRGKDERIQTLIERLGAVEARLVHGIVGEGRVAETLFDQTAVVPGVAQLRTFGEGRLEQLQCVFKGIVAALRRNALERLDDKVLPGAAANSLGVTQGQTITKAVNNSSGAFRNRREPSFSATCFAFAPGFLNDRAFIASDAGAHAILSAAAGLRG